jgi:hypothetical protein
MALGGLRQEDLAAAKTSSPILARMQPEAPAGRREQGVIPPENLIIAGTHTHSSVGLGMLKAMK